jgi:hypothetical protein
LSILTKPESGQDTGGYWSNATAIGDEKAKLDDYNSVRDFFQLHVDSYILSAAMILFNINLTKDDFLPEIVKESTDIVKQDWLYTQVHSFVKQFIFDDTKLRQEMCILQGPFKCDVCEKEYQLHTGLIRHMRKVHDQIVQPPTSQVESSEDYIYNYGCATISLGLLLRDFHDAV